MSGLNPNFKQSRNSLNKELSLVRRPALSTILCIDLAPSKSAMANVKANGYMAIGEALAQGYTWKSIAEFFGCSQAHIRCRWYVKLSAKDRNLLNWCERIYYENIAQTILKRMGVECERVYEMPEGMDQWKFEMYVADLKLLKIKTLQRVGNVAMKQLNILDRMHKSKEREQQMAQVPVVNIIQG